MDNDVTANPCWQTIEDLERQVEALFRMQDSFSNQLGQFGDDWCCQGKDGDLRDRHCAAMLDIERHLEEATFHLTDMYVELCFLGDLECPGGRDKACQTVRAHFSNWQEYMNCLRRKFAYDRARKSDAGTLPQS